MSKALAFLIVVFLFSCVDATSEKGSIETEEKETITISPVHLDTSRLSNLSRLDSLKSINAPRVVHILVPLCDNDNQGIVPVNAALGNGQNLKSNLYWGAGYGIRTFFDKSQKWTRVSRHQTKEEILERLVYKRSTAKENVYIVMDAYNGAQMKMCLEDYFNSLAGVKIDSVHLPDGSSLPVNGDANLLIFNGHNGLMDEEVEPAYNQDGITKDAVAIACVSGSYFKPYLKKAGGYPLLMTTNLLAPEAYVVHSVIEKWIANSSEAEVRMAAGRAYNQYQKCGIRGALNLFETGW